MEQQKGGEERHAADSETDLVFSPAIRAALRRSDERTIRLLFNRLRIALFPLARAQEPRGHEAEELLTTFLDDFLVDLPTLAIEPSQLKRYAVACFRNHVKMVRRGDAAREHAYERAASAFGECGAIVAECQSEYSVAASHESGSTAEQPHPALIALARHLRSHLSRDEKLLLHSMIKGVPLRTISEWLGIEYSACRVKLHRLRWRLQREAILYSRTVAPEERQTLNQLFVHLGVTNPETEDHP